MNPTKNIGLIEVDKDFFEEICNLELDDRIKKIQEAYLRLKEEAEGKIKKWMKLRDRDCFLETEHKVLVPDTRKLEGTAWYENVDVGSYEGLLSWIASWDKGKLAEVKKRAENDRYIFPSSFPKEVEGVSVSTFSLELLVALFDCSCPFLEGSYLKTGTRGWGGIIFDAHSLIYSVLNKRWGYYKEYSGAIVLPMHLFEEEKSALEVFIKHDIYPEDFDEEMVTRLKECKSLLSAGVDVEDFHALKKYFIDDKVERFLGFDLRLDAIENDLEAEEIDLKAEVGTGFYLRTYFDQCDYRRAKIQKYYSKWYLADEGRGHWELWRDETSQIEATEKETEKAEEAKEEEVKKIPLRLLKIKDGVIARNPLSDVKHNAVVGIDFGTKSTIVALQDSDEQIIPLRVGMADYSKTPEAAHYENPTVMQFVHLSKFINQYHKWSGRPRTEWEDLLVSHEAFQNMIDSEESIDISSFITDLKQWSSGRYGNNGGHLIIKDVGGYRFDIERYLSLTGEDIDLIELYAYYIGLFINNMHTGLYLDYLLSFPETFSRELREKLLQSFTKGFKKSLPTSIFMDESCKEEFRVRQGPSEPAAYAACALEQFGIEPTDEGEFYGIFDFGGGTTDYDYGIWKNAPKEEFTYNYIIKHYGSGGDKTLGGENILQLLAYYVFSDDSTQNQDTTNLSIMRSKKITYFKPEEGEVFSGTEGLNDWSEAALLNTKLMMEALRPIWEDWAEFKQWSGKKKTNLDIFPKTKNTVLHLSSNGAAEVRLLLFTETGREEVTLVIPLDFIKGVIHDRIESGIKNFFEGLRLAYEKSEMKENEKIHIFLAGNSSKSKVVMEIFEDYIGKYSNIMFEEQADVSLEESDEEEYNDDEEEYEEEEEINHHFIIYPPLGTEEARIMQRKNGVEVEEEDLMAPTCKTGVAFGLVMCREGSMIRVEPETKVEDQIKLNYYIGMNYRKQFRLIFDRSSQYNKWLKFSKIAKDTTTFEFYYTELPEVISGEVIIKENKAIFRKKCLVDQVKTDATIFFRFTEPNKLEYVVALEDKVEAGEYLSKVYTVEL